MERPKFKEVYYNQYCNKCKYESDPEDSDKCNECLNDPAREFTHKPLNYEEKD